MFQGVYQEYLELKLEYEEDEFSLEEEKSEIQGMLDHINDFSFKDADFLEVVILVCNLKIKTINALLHNEDENEEEEDET